MADQEACILEGYNQLAKYVYLKIAEHDGDVLLSSDIYQLLLLISQDASYQNKDTFTRLLGVNDINEAAQHYDEISPYSNFVNDGTFLISSKAFLREGYALREAFKALMKKSFNCEPGLLDFAKNEVAARAINLWVEGKTNKKAKNLVHRNLLNEEERLALLNTIYLEAKLADPFTVADITSATFHLNDNDTIDAQMIKTRREFLYKDDERIGVKVLELPCTNQDLSLFFVLPKHGTTVTNLERELVFNDPLYIIRDTSKQEIDVCIPKFEIERSDDLKNILNEIGLTAEFSENAGLFGMVDSDEFLCFSSVEAKTTINFNEEGCEAASGTIFTLVPSKIDEQEYSPKDGLVIYEMDIKSNISNRFAKNLVVCKVKNTNKSAKEATFSVVLPETAFITEFVMEIEGNSYKADIKRKGEAKTIYNEALISGKSAGIVEASTRDSNEFSVSVNLEPDSIAVFSLTYEEMLQRICDQYELVLNIRPGQIVEKVNVEVNINESRPLKFVKTPPLRSGNEISKDEKYLIPSTDIKIINPSSATVKYCPDSKQQKRIARYLGTNVADGFSGQFVVQYDVERDPQDGEILLQDGYFVHFFAPNDLDPLPKHVVFVLDTSTSMEGRKIFQLKDAMFSILSELRTDDIVSIIEFNSNVVVWDISAEKSTTFSFHGEEIFQDPFRKLSEFSLPNPAYATKETINKAKNVIKKICVGGYTFMIGGLETGLYLIKLEQEKNSNNTNKYQPIMVFLTDGAPNVGMSSTDQIVKTVTKLNFRYNKVPIFSLSFGFGADKEFLRQLSLKNMGFSRHIYEASDASLQLQAFYKQISSPLLSDVKFKYESGVKEVTKTRFPIYFRGAELVVSGRYEGSSVPVFINCCGPRGQLVLNSIPGRPVTALERLWAYLTVKHLLEEKDFVEDNTELIKRATELALKYSFVTEVTSLVVVKPEETDTVTTADYLVEELPEELTYTELITIDSGDDQNFRKALTVPKKCCIKKRIIKKREEGKRPVVVTVMEEVEREPPQKELPQEEGFIANRPFIVLVVLKKGDEQVILFIGRVSKPCNQ